MRNNAWEKASLLINNKPKDGKFYQIPEQTLLYANQVLSSPALRLWIVIAGQANGFEGAMETYCQRAKIDSRHYKRYRDELVEKGFLLVELYKSMTVIYPIQPDIDSQTGNEEDSDSQTGDDGSRTGNEDTQTGNVDSQDGAHNIETNKQIVDNTIDENNKRPKDVSVNDRVAGSNNSPLGELKLAQELGLNIVPEEKRYYEQAISISIILEIFKTYKNDDAKIVFKVLKKLTSEGYCLKYIYAKAKEAKEISGYDTIASLTNFCGFSDRQKNYKGNVKTDNPIDFIKILTEIDEEKLNTELEKRKLAEEKRKEEEIEAQKRAAELEEYRQKKDAERKKQKQEAEAAEKEEKERTNKLAESVADFIKKILIDKEYIFEDDIRDEILEKYGISDNQLLDFKLNYFRKYGIFHLCSLEDEYNELVDKDDNKYGNNIYIYESYTYTDQDIIDFIEMEIFRHKNVDISKLTEKFDISEEELNVVLDKLDYKYFWDKENGLVMSIFDLENNDKSVLNELNPDVGTKKSEKGNSNNFNTASTLGNSELKLAKENLEYLNENIKSKTYALVKDIPVEYEEEDLEDYILANGYKRKIVVGNDIITRI